MIFEDDLNRIKVWGSVYRFVVVEIQSITKHALIKINHKTCADQKQPSEVFVPQSSLFILLYDPTRIHKARLSILISGNLLFA